MFFSGPQNIQHYTPDEYQNEQSRFEKAYDRLLMNITTEEKKCYEMNHKQCPIVN